MVRAATRVKSIKQAVQVQAQAEQGELAFAPQRKVRKRTRGVKLGRKPRVERDGFVPHLTRPVHDERHPVHVTIRRVRMAPSLRAQRVRTEIIRQIRLVARRGVRVIQYCIQDDHLHLMAEASDKTRLARGMQLLFSRIAFAVNRMSARAGSLFRDRHHRHVLKTPTEVRNALVYILFNTRKHDRDLHDHEYAANWIDEASSTMWFEGWDERKKPPPDEVKRKRDQIGECPLTAPKTWLARIGWQRAKGGPIRFNEMPKIH